MCSTIEPRRATVSCKNLFTSTNNERSRRHTQSNAHSKRTSNSGVAVSTPTPTMPLKQSNVFHIPFTIEPTYDVQHSKLLRTRLNPLSPAFHSTKQFSTNVESKLTNDHHRLLLQSETSDYGSGTDPDQQSIQQITPPTGPSAFTFDIDESNLVGSSSTHSSSLRRTSLSSSSSSSSSSSTSSPTSPSSSISNLSSLSSSSEFQRSFPVQHRLTTKKTLSTPISQSHVSTNNEISSCSCNKENQPIRKRNRPNVFTSRRSAAVAQPTTTINSNCQNCQGKRTKANGNSRTKQVNKRQRAQQTNQTSSSSTTSFTVNLTGLNIHYTVEQHEPMKCTYYPIVLPYCNSYSSVNRCRCSTLTYANSITTSSMCEWHPTISPAYVYHPSEHFPTEIYYVGIDWISPPVTPLYNYDLYFSKSPSEFLSTISFSDSFSAEIDFDSKMVQPPPDRSWLSLSSPSTSQSTANFTVMNYNILCDKYATRRVFGYCPSWALKWEYRRKQILDELRFHSADIIALQEIETDQFHLFFLPELRALGYDGVFSPKSRAKTMCEQDRRFVDGCAIFYRQSKFRLIKDYLVEFNQLAMSARNTPACHDMMNRVMTKDNIGLVALLETKDDICSQSDSDDFQSTAEKQMLFVCTAHIHWDPEYCDVKVIQTLLLLSELKMIMEDAIQKHRTHPSIPADCTSVPLVLCGDFNSLPDSGVIQLMRDGKISTNHADFKDLRYDSFLQRISRMNVDTTSGSDIIHPFKLQSAYETTSSPIMPYTNYTFDFKGIIDYVFYSSQLMRVLGVLGPMDPDWLKVNKIVGCPQPNVPSDHFPLLVEFELNRLIDKHLPATNHQDIRHENSLLDFRDDSQS